MELDWLKNNAFLGLHTLHTLDNPKEDLKIFYTNFSKDLKNKLISCLDQNDWAYEYFFLKSSPINL